MQASNQNSKSSRMLILASLRHHNPDEIYDYVEKNVGPLGMCIKKRQAVIGFENAKFYQKLMSFNGAMLYGRKLKLTYFDKGNENQIVSQQQEEVIQISKVSEQQSKGGTQKKFRPQNNVQSKINNHRILMKEKIEDSFNTTLQICRDRVQQMKLQFKENSLYDRQIRSLQQTLEKKFAVIQNKYDEQIKKLMSYIKNFSYKPVSIQIEPTFKTQPTSWIYKNVQLDNLKMKPELFFSNQDRYPCKRICPINGEQFAVSMFNDVKKLGAIKIYNVNKCDQKFAETHKNGAYGMCCVNNYLLVGSYKSTISYINLNDEQRDIQSSSRFISDQFQLIDLMVFKNDPETPQILVLAREKQRKLRKLKITKDQIAPGLQSLSFEQNLQIPSEDIITSFDIGAKNILWFGGSKKIFKYCFVTGRKREVLITQEPAKIKKFNENLLAIGSPGVISFFDTRSDTIVQKFPFLPKDINSLEVINQNNIIYGSHSEIGVLDDRKIDLILWKDKTHKGFVYDIAKMNKQIITCDSAGLIYSWTLDFQKNQSIKDINSDTIMID